MNFLLCSENDSKIASVNIQKSKNDNKQAVAFGWFGSTLSDENENEDKEKETAKAHFS